MPPPKLIGEVPDGSHFELISTEELLGFDSIQITRHTTVGDGYQRPEAVSVFFPDGSVIADIPANTCAFILRPLRAIHGVDVEVGIERAAHIKFLHIDGLDPGSTFLEGSTLESVLNDLCQILPTEVSEENYKHKAWTLDMERDFGWENLCSLQELVEQGLITSYEVGIMNDYHKNITQKNRSGTDEEKMAYVDGFNRRFPRAKIFLRLIRSPANVIIPHVVGQPHLTSQVMVALSTRYGEGRKKLHTFTPGRAMGRHPIPGEHRNPNRGTVDNQSFRNSAWNWTHHALLVPSRDLPRF